MAASARPAWPSSRTTGWSSSWWTGPTTAGWSATSIWGGSRRSSPGSRRRSSISGMRRARSSTPPICWSPTRTTRNPTTTTSRRLPPRKKPGARQLPRQREVSSRRAVPDIAEILKKGQTRPVQVTKEPISTKGCRVTAQISLPGRFLVYMPYASRVGVSRKIENREQRARLREIVTRLLPEDSGGVIVRTVAEEVTEEHFKREIDSLLNQWRKIKRKQLYVRKAPALLQREAS